MIQSKEMLTMAEVNDLLKNAEKKEVVKEYLKKFTKLSKDNALKLKDEIRALNNPKIKEEDIIKIVDFLPKDQQELAIIFKDSPLSEEETNAILNIVNKY